MKVSVLGLIVLTLALSISCGRKKSSTTVIQNKETVNLLEESLIEKVTVDRIIEIKNIDGKKELSFGQLGMNIENSKKLSLTNNSESDLTIKVVFEKGQYFYFSGGAFPGINGTCLELLKAKQTCELDISLQSSIAGVFEDTLYIYLENGEKTSIPLFGERVEVITKDNTQSEKIKWENFVGLNLDFGEVSLGSELTKDIELNNISEKTVNIKEIKLQNAKEFSLINHNACLGEMKAGTCKFKVKYVPNLIGESLDVLTVIDEDGKKLLLNLSALSRKKELCLIKEQKMIKANIINEENRAFKVLPYLSKSKNTGYSLSNLYGTDFNVQVRGVSIRTVRDAQVLVEFKVVDKINGGLVDIGMDIDVWKIITDDFRDTELLCLSSKSVKKCSGKMFMLESWKKLINPEFFKNGKVVNEIFLKKLSSNSKKCGDLECEVLREEISFKEVFGLTDAEFKSLLNDKIFNIILADDSRFLSLPVIKLYSEKQTDCK